MNSKYIVRLRCENEYSLEFKKESYVKRKQGQMGIRSLVIIMILSPNCSLKIFKWCLKIEKIILNAIIYIKEIKIHFDLTRSFSWKTI